MTIEKLQKMLDEKIKETKKEMEKGGNGWIKPFKEAETLDRAIKIEKAKGANK